MSWNLPDGCTQADFDRLERQPCPNCGSDRHRLCDPDAVHDEQAERETEE